MAPRAEDIETVGLHEDRGLDAQLGAAGVAAVVFHVYQFCDTTHFLYVGTPAYTVLNSLDAAVTWLFVILGFLLFEPVARAVVDGRPSFEPRRFLGLTAVRVLPVYYVAIAAVWLLRQPSLPGDWRDLLEHLTFTQVFDEKRIFWTIGAAWALSVAVWVYLLLMGVGIVVTRIARRLVERRQRIILLAGGVCALFVVSLVWKASSLILDHPARATFTTWFGPLAQLDIFTIGMVVALVVVVRPVSATLDRRQRFTLQISGSVLLVAAFVLRAPDSWTDRYFGTACAIAFGCLIAATVLGPPVNCPGRSGAKALRWLGKITLSTYLWHEPVLLASRHLGLVRQAPEAFARDVLIVIPLSVLAGWLSWTAIERPVRQLAREFTRTRVRGPMGTSTSDMGAVTADAGSGPGLHGPDKAPARR